MVHLLVSVISRGSRHHLYEEKGLRPVSSVYFLGYTHYPLLHNHVTFYKTLHTHVAWAGMGMTTDNADLQSDWCTEISLIVVNWTKLLA